MRSAMIAPPASSGTSSPRSMMLTWRAGRPAWRQPAAACRRSRAERSVRRPALRWVLPRSRRPEQN
jgi:hypothetical protein